MPRFDKIGICFDLDPLKKYELPEDKQVTHIGLKNGNGAFFWSPDEVVAYKSQNNWLFLKVPEGAKALAFPEVKKTISGWDYGIMSANGYKRVDA